MTLLAPAALWLFLTSGAVVALYLLKIRRRRQLLPDLELWRQFVSQSPVRSLFQQLKRWLSMLLWLVIVACLVLAIANPILSLGKIKPAAIAVVLDNSASMMTREPDDKVPGAEVPVSPVANAGQSVGAEDAQPSAVPNRMDLARAELAELIHSRPVSDEWLLIEAGREPVVRQTWTRDGRSVVRHAESLPPFLGEAPLGSAVTLARQLLAGKENPRLIVITDGCAPDAADVLDGEDVIVRAVGRPRDNLGVTHIGVRARREDLAHHVYVRVVNAGTERVEARLVFEIDEATVAVEPMDVEAGGDWRKTVALEAPSGGVLRAWIDRPDALDVDNEAFAVLEPIRPARVLLISPREQAFFFEQAMAAMSPLVDPGLSRSISSEDFARAAGGPGDEDKPDLYVVNGPPPENLPATGRFVFVNGWPTDVPVRVTGELGNPMMSLADADHPLTRFMDVRSVHLAAARRVDPLERCTILARSGEDTPLIFLHRGQDRDALCLAFDVFDTDLPFRTAFPVFLRNAVAWLTGEGGALVREQYAVGEVIRPQRPLDGNPAQVSVGLVRGGEVVEEPLAVRGGSFSFNGADRPRPVRIRVGDDVYYTAVNLHSEAESSIVPRAFEQPVGDFPVSRSLLGAAPWLWLAGLASLLVALEWLTYHHRWTE
jgi:hypothetical protein